TEKAGEFVVEIRNGNPKHQIVFAQKLGTVMICNEVATAEAAHVLAEDLAKNSKVTIGEGGIHAFIPMAQPDDSDLAEKKQRLRDQIKIDRENLTEAEEKELWRILDAHIDAFATTLEEMGFTTLVEHDIELEPGTKPIRQKNRRFPFTVQDELEKEIKKLLDLGVIRQSDSDWASPIVQVRKKDRKIRMCIDYRKVNAVSVKDVSPLAHLNELLDKAGMEGNQFFSSMDLMMGYHQVKMTKEAERISTFVCHLGAFSYIRLPFGLCNAPSTFSNLMRKVLATLQRNTVFTYLDDVLVATPSMETHLKQLEQVLVRFVQVGLTIKPEKSHLCSTQL
ncbi:MAG: hypothetical protein GY795_48415, partial [Desulfobacterales bacterium]|nr:hypothetical protein [Desulfobacterales bacterium]